jgi:catechol 2,3-dioxygenase-like lactoylglutathione lyase family enzyme
MPAASPLWPARLHHIEITTPQLAAMRDFYVRAFAYRAEALGDGRALLRVGYRRVLLAPGPAQGLGLAAYALGGAAQLEALRGHLGEQGLAVQPAATPLFEPGAIAVQDPDGRTLAFGLPRGRSGAARAADAETDALMGRLQHVVVTTLDLAAVQRFYEGALGFVLSDRVLQEGGAPSTVFYRSDPEHHSFAAFLSDGVRLDHYALDAPDWNAIRDWSDHFAAERIPIVWGPGRHGPGNNLFCMVADPDGNMVEISTELEQMPREMPARDWPHTERSLNLWGGAIMRI